MKMETSLYFSAYILSLTCVCATIHVAYYMYLSGGSRSPCMFVVVLHQMLHMCINKGVLLYFVLHVIYILCTLSGGGLLYIQCFMLSVCMGGGGLY